MNIDATPETIRAVADVLKYAAFLDDRIGNADQGRIAAWAEQVQRHELRGDDLMAGLRGFYDSGHSYPCGVGDLIEHSLIARRDRTSRGQPTPPEDDSARDARLATFTAKAAEDIAELAERKGIPTVKYQPPTSEYRNWLSVRCPWEACHAPVGRACPVAGGAHPSRKDLAGIQ